MNALTIARFTLQEAVRRRLILAALVLSLAFVGLFALGFSLLYQEAAREAQQHNEEMLIPLFGSIMTVLGLFAVHFLSSFLALFLSVGAISGEVDSGTLHAVMARPIRRSEFVLGRWLAYVSMIGVYVGVMAAMLLGIARVISGFEAPDPIRAIGFMMLSTVLLLTLSLLGSSVLSTLANGVVVFSLFGVAWLAGIIEFVGTAMQNSSMVNLGIAVSLLVPSDALWRGASYYVQSPVVLAAAATLDGPPLPFAASSPPTTALALWSIAYVAIMLVAAMGAFRNRDL